MTVDHDVCSVQLARQKSQSFVARLEDVVLRRFVEHRLALM